MDGAIVVSYVDDIIFFLLEGAYPTQCLRMRARWGPIGALIDGLVQNHDAVRVPAAARDWAVKLPDDGRAALGAFAAVLPAESGNDFLVVVARFIERDDLRRDVLVSVVIALGKPAELDGIPETQEELIGGRIFPELSLVGLDEGAGEGRAEHIAEDALLPAASFVIIASAKFIMDVYDGNRETRVLGEPVGVQGLDPRKEFRRDYAMGD